MTIVSFYWINHTIVVVLMESFKHRWHHYQKKSYKYDDGHMTMFLYWFKVNCIGLVIWLWSCVNHHPIILNKTSMKTTLRIFLMYWKRKGLIIVNNMVEGNWKFTNTEYIILVHTFPKFEHIYYLFMYLLVLV